MNLCSDNHDEVCYSEGHCPCCIIILDLNIAEATVKEQRSEIKNLQSQVEDLETQNENLLKEHT